MANSEMKIVGIEGAKSRTWLDLVRQQVNSLDYGVVQITVHNGRVTQIERTERTRLDPAAVEVNSASPNL